jgi:hypothetical protein
VFLNEDEYVVLVILDIRLYFRVIAIFYGRDVELTWLLRTAQYKYHSMFIAAKSRTCTIDMGPVLIHLSLPLALHKEKEVLLDEE